MHVISVVPKHAIIYSTLQMCAEGCQCRPSETGGHLRDRIVLRGADKNGAGGGHAAATSHVPCGGYALKTLSSPQDTVAKRNGRLNGPNAAHTPE